MGVITPTATLDDKPQARTPGRRAYARAVLEDVTEADRLAPRDEAEAWLSALHSEGHERERAVERLHAMILRATRFELSRRRAALSFVRGEELDDLAMQAANDALAAVLSKLDQFRGASRFTTWVYKFALLEAGVRLRRRAWQDREVVLDPDDWQQFADRGSPLQAQLEQAELLDELKDALESALTAHQRRIFVALALNEVPIDVLAGRLGATRGALYKTLHDARARLRKHLAASGHALAGDGMEEEVAR
jgi:RNA polymerase sigma-70 factor (ECF subfamily)